MQTLRAGVVPGGYSLVDCFRGNSVAGYSFPGKSPREIVSVMALNQKGAIGGPILCFLPLVVAGVVALSAIGGSVREFAKQSVPDLVSW